MTLCLLQKPVPRNWISLAGAAFLSIFIFFPRQISAHSLYVSVGQDSARVTLDDLELGFTDSLGVFYGEPVSSGFHRLGIEKEGFRAVLDTVFVPEGLTYNYTTPLEPFRLIVINEITGREADSVGGPYTVQLGAFRSRENAGGLVESWQGGKYEPRLESAVVKGLGNVYRVRLSFFKSLEQAREAAGEIIRKAKQDVWIVGLDNRDWAVQLAAFKVRSQAERLAARLKDPELYVWVEDSPSGMFKVKAGYWPDRVSAKAASRKIAASLRVKPLVIRVR